MRVEARRKLSDNFVPVTRVLPLVSKATRVGLIFSLLSNIDSPTGNIFLSHVSFALVHFLEPGWCIG